jgi:hypothetical protein
MVFHGPRTKTRSVTNEHPESDQPLPFPSGPSSVPSGPSTVDSARPDRRLCGECGWPVDQPAEVISRHLTSEGLVVYTRCVCGRLQVSRIWAPGPGYARLA